MKFTVENKGEVNLTDKDYLSAGGEATIYTQGNVIYKIYTDISKIIPLTKVDELKKLLGGKDNILTPKDVVYNKNKYVGFTMDMVDDTVPLCKLFTNDFRNKNGVNPNHTIQLIEKFQEDINFIHEKGCLIVDVNEFNFLISTKNKKNKAQKFVYPYFIDVNSYQTPTHGATAIMPNIRDYHTKSFSDVTDWYSFGILACQLFVGIHPFKGTHKNYKNNDFVSRMKDNISIFNKDVKVPSVTRDFNLIPDDYKKWFVDIFENGKRTQPPFVLGIIKYVPVTIKPVTSTQCLIIETIKEFDENIFSYTAFAGNEVILCENKAWVQKKLDYFCENDNCLIFKDNDTIACNIDSDNTLYFKNIKNNEVIITPFKAKEFKCINNNMFLKYNDKLIQALLPDGMSQFIVKNSWDILPNASKFFDGCLYQDTLGKPYFYIPYINNTNDCMYIGNIVELEGYKIINAKHNNRILMVLGVKQNRYFKFLFRFEKDYNKYHLIYCYDDVDYKDLNFTVLDNGVGVSIEDNNELNIFHTDASKIKIVKDDNLPQDLTLCTDGSKIMCYKDKTLYTLRMKP